VHAYADGSPKKYFLKIFKKKLKEERKKKKVSVQDILYEK